MSRTHIAVVIAGLLLGAQAGIAALNESPETVETESMGASAALEQTDAAQLASAAEPVTEQQAAPAAVEAPKTVSVAHVFPLSANEPNMLPALVAYLDQRIVPQGPVLASSFPGSADEPAMLPALVAHFDARNAPVAAAAESPLVTALAPRE